MEIPETVTLEETIALSATVGEALKHAGLTIATAESCTGGLIGHLLTEISGSSAWMWGGAITYTNDMKEKLLGVRHETLLAYGAVSAQTAAEMAAGARQLVGADVALSATGIAGPGGAVPGKPVGTVHLHISAADGYERGERFVWTSDRSGNKLLSAYAALRMTLDYLRVRE